MVFVNVERYKHCKSIVGNITEETIRTSNRCALYTFVIKMKGAFFFTTRPRKANFGVNEDPERDQYEHMTSADALDHFKRCKLRDRSVFQMTLAYRCGVLVFLLLILLPPFFLPFP